MPPHTEAASLAMLFQTDVRADSILPQMPVMAGPMLDQIEPKKLATGAQIADAALAMDSHTPISQSCTAARGGVAGMSSQIAFPHVPSATSAAVTSGIANAKEANPAAVTPKPANR